MRVDTGDTSRVRDGEELPFPLEPSEPAGSQVHEGGVRAVMRSCTVLDTRIWDGSDSLMTRVSMCTPIPAMPRRCRSTSPASIPARMSRPVPQSSVKTSRRTDRLLRGLEDRELAVAELLHHSTTEPLRQFLGPRPTVASARRVRTRRAPVDHHPRAERREAAATGRRRTRSRSRRGQHGSPAGASGDDTGARECPLST
jgi:hypothetical protein